MIKGFLSLDTAVVTCSVVKAEDQEFITVIPRLPIVAFFIKFLLLVMIY
jgi:hypothetical protein|tara:strand:- start:537 stop:683 length:147 start_codon:yes stop_codon:yes gene_type:complete